MKLIKLLTLMLLAVSFLCIGCSSDDAQSTTENTLNEDAVISVEALDGSVRKLTKLQLYAELIKELKRVNMFNQQVASRLGLQYPPVIEQKQPVSNQKTRTQPQQSELPRQNTQQIPNGNQQVQPQGQVQSGGIFNNNQ